MLKIKTLTSSLTAVALVSGIGFAYAQATNEPATPPSTTQQQPTSTTETPSTTTPSTTESPSQPMANEPAPQADRN